MYINEIRGGRAYALPLFFLQIDAVYDLVYNVKRKELSLRKNLIGRMIYTLKVMKISTLLQDIH